ncbi:MAG: PAS domain-containing protein [Myxococcales bacterium]|nr:PAS domain-containing protein [Myxococcales bacterium]
MPIVDERLSRRVAWLMLARVVLLLLVLGAAVVLEASAGHPDSRSQGWVLRAVLAGLAATIGSGLLLRRFRSPLAFGVLQIATDIGVATAIVHVTGAGDSVFSFLYVIIVAYAALLFDRRLSVGAAVFASLAYTASLVATSRGLGVLDPALPPPSLLLVIADASVKSGALLVVASLSSGLSRELARADRALDERTRDFGRLRDLHELTVQSLGSGLLTTDPEGIVRSFNREAQRITGVAGADALGQPIASLLPGAGQLFELDAERQRERIAFTSAEGTPLHLGFATSVLRDAEGRPGGHVVIFQDITAIVEMENDLRRSERLAAVGELAAGIAHEIRNPLASISGSVQMLQSGLSEEDLEQRRLMDIVLRETDRLDGLISDFLHYARPAPPERKEVDLTALTSELQEMYDTARPADVTTGFEVEADLRAWADPDQLRQLLWNLLLNGGQAMDDGGSLQVAARCLDAQEAALDGRHHVDGERSAQVEITVSDTGSGIDPELLDRVFDPFFTTKPRGSGLGLAMVHRIVEANEGTVSVESELGKGTTFRVRLPAAPRRQAHGPEAPASDAVVADGGFAGDAA